MSVDVQLGQLENTTTEPWSLSWLLNIHILEEHDDGNIWLVNPDESDNLQEAGHPCEATKQPKATSLQIENNQKKTFGRMLKQKPQHKRCVRP